MRLPVLLSTMLLVACSNLGSQDSDLDDSDLVESGSNVKTEHSLGKVQTDTVNYINYSDEVLVEDLNGDGFPEVVSRVAEPKLNQIGVRVLDGKQANKFTVFGAGNEVDGMTNLVWIGSMKLIPVGETVAATLVNHETGDIIGPDTANQVLLQNPAVLFLAKDTHEGGIMYWTGTEYAWLHLE